MKPLKVWFLLDRLFGSHGGTEKQALMLMRELCALGHDVRLFLLRHTDYSRGIADSPYPIEVLQVDSLRSWRALRHMWGFRGRVRRERPDVVHAFLNDSAILAPLFGRTRHTAVLTSRRDMGFWYDAPTLAVLRQVNRRANVVVCNAEAVAREVHRREGVPLSRLRVIYNGIEERPPGDASGTPATPRVLATAATTEGALVACLLANVRRIKRIEDFVEAAARLRTVCPQWQYLVIGSPQETEYQAELQALARRLGVSDRVHFAGALMEPGPALRACHVGVLTSESEGLSNSILEYMRAGLPVVCSNTGGNPELVTHGTDGLLYRTGDVAQLAFFLAQLGGDAALRRAMGTAAARAAQRFSIAAMTHAHLRAYAELRAGS